MTCFLISISFLPITNNVIFYSEHDFLLSFSVLLDTIAVVFNYLNRRERQDSCRKNKFGMLQDYPSNDEEKVSSFLFLFIVIKRLNRSILMNTASDMHPTLFSNFVLIHSSACEYGPKEPLSRYFPFCYHPVCFLIKPFLPF